MMKNFSMIFITLFFVTLSVSAPASNSNNADHAANADTDSLSIDTLARMRSEIDEEKKTEGDKSNLHLNLASHHVCTMQNADCKGH